MSQLLEQATKILKENRHLVALNHWKPVEEVVRRNKKAILFRDPPPRPTCIFLILEPGDLYIYEDGDIEFVDNDEGKEFSVDVSMMEAAEAIIGEDIVDVGLQGIEFEESGFVLRFGDNDGVLYRPHYLVNLETKTAEYFSDSDDPESGTNAEDQIPF
jgi:hypothetical protein